MSQKLSLKKQFISDGLRLAEIDAFLQKELAQDGYVEVTLSASADTKNLYIYCTQKIAGDEGRRVRELSALISARFNLDPSTLKCFFGKVAQRGLSAASQCEAVKHRLLTGLAVRQAAYSVLRTVMAAGARGCEVVISGKVRDQRAKAMKFVDGVMVHAGHAASTHVEVAVRHVYMRQGILGVRVTINKSQDPGLAPTDVPSMLPDHVYVLQPKEDEPMRYSLPFSTNAKGELIVNQQQQQQQTSNPQHQQMAQSVQH